MNKKSIFNRSANNYLTHPMENKGITLIALVVTVIVNLVSYDKNKKYSDLVGFSL